MYMSGLKADKVFADIKQVSRNIKMDSNAQVMIDLAKNRHSELWLTQFKFIGDNITLAGQATHGSAIPIWLNGLKNTDYFSAKTFS